MSIGSAVLWFSIGCVLLPLGSHILVSGAVGLAKLLGVSDLIIGLIMWDGRRANVWEKWPIGIQIFGDKIDSMRKAAAIAEAANPELVDINYGCPVKKVACKGAGAGILLDLPKMQEMTAEIVKAVDKPVTVKTRLGWDDDTIKIVEVAKRLQDVGIQALTIHGRTRKQMYKGEVRSSYESIMIIYFIG